MIYPKVTPRSWLAWAERTVVAAQLTRIACNILWAEPAVAVLRMLTYVGGRVADVEAILDPAQITVYTHLDGCWRWPLDPQDHPSIAEN